MAWDLSVSVGHMPTFLKFRLHPCSCRTSHCRGKQDAGLDFHDISLASGRADVVGYEFSPPHVAWILPNEWCVFAQSRGRSLCVDATAAVRWSSSMITSPVRRSAFVVRSESSAPVQSSLVRLIWRPDNCR